MSEHNDENSFRNILKNTSIFGGVQVFLVLISILRGKFVAVLLGTGGMGISSLFTSTSNLITQMSSLGLNLAIVREVSEAQTDVKRFSKLMQLLRRLLLVTAFGGALFTALFSRWLSEVTFGDTSYSWQFVLLGIFVFLTVMGNGYMSVLQGLHEVKRLSRSSLTGAVVGLVFGVPLYYFFGVKGIVPALILFGLTTFSCYAYNVHKSREKEANMPFRWADHKDAAKKLLLLGMVLMASDLINRACTYGLNLFIRSNGGVDMVGLYQAGNSITAQYVGTVFTALSLDYFPRLTKVMKDRAAMSAVVNRQTITVNLLMGPLVSILILSTPILIPLLLSSEFEPIVPFVRLMGLVMLSRAFIYPMGFIAFAGNRKKMFFWMEAVTANAMTFVLSILGYHCGGLNGLAVGMIIDNILCFGLYYAVNSKVFGYRLSGVAAGECVLMAVGCGLLWASSLLENATASWTAMSVITVAITTYSLLRLRRLLRK